MATAHSTDHSKTKAHAKHPGAGDTPPVVEHLPLQWRPSPVIPGLPIGVAILSLITAISGFIVFLSGALVLLNAYLPDTVPSNVLIFPAGDPLGAAILLLLGVVLVGVANALWHQERWSLYLTVGVLFAGEAYLFFTATITVLFLIFLVIFVYLLTVRDHFY
ncbi:MAG: hypothetical protein L3K08_03650 [Thermoplasmata archaeon]|nr:hypothetical protein [Thermoplasmata archaeon]